MEKNKKIIAGIAGAVALIAIVAVCIFAFGSGKEKKKQQQLLKQLQYLKLQHSLKVSVCLQESI